MVCTGYSNVAYPKGYAHIKRTSDLEAMGLTGEMVVAELLR
jgi:hypothetical protein